MKRGILILIAGLLLISHNVFADDVSIDSSGNVKTGVSNSNAELEVTGGSGEGGILGTASGTGASGVYGVNTSYGDYGILGYYGYGVYGYSPSGWAGYFQGNARVTGNLTVDGSLIGPGIGDITGVTAGTGLTGGGTGGDVTLNVNTTYLQRRISSSCTVGSSIRAINEDGTVLCETDDAGITSESDPEVGTITTNYVPKWNGSELVTGSIFDNGNVGIGTTAPESKLHISGGGWDLTDSEGDFKIGNATYRLKIGIATGGGGAGDVRIRSHGGTGRIMLGGGTNDILTVTSTNVGIGTISPSQMLTVAGTIESTSGGIKFPDGTLLGSANITPPLQSPRTNSITTVDSTGDVGWFTSITIGTDGLPVISYYDSTNGDLKVIKCGNASCSSGNTITAVDSGGYVGQYTSITIGTDGQPVISYYDSTNGDLKVIKCGNAFCSSGNTITAVDSTGDVGWFTSITIGTDGPPVISYSDFTNKDLKVAKCGNASCSSGNTITAVDSTEDVGQYTSITIGTDGQPVISYLDGTNGDLKVAKCWNAFCSSGSTITAVDSAGYVGQYTSITIGTDGQPVISYSTGGDLKVAKCGNASCSSGNTLNTVDIFGYVGQYTSITIGTDGLPVISYYTNSDLKVAKCANQFCLNNWSRR
jgi:hypothetical protein